MGMGFDDARHLLARTSLGTPPEAIARFAEMTRGEAVDALVGGIRDAPHTAPPAWVEEPPPSRLERRTMREAVRARQRERFRELQAWWYQEMWSTASPLTERLVLFWHNHFTTAFKKVRFPTALYRQNTTFRRLAGGSFAELLLEASREPAMIGYLDNITNRRDAPNENFARELFELFTLGEGQDYTEADIKEAARAFTGWKVNRKRGTFRFARRHFDPGKKTVLGHTGRLSGEDVIAILLEHPRTAVHITERLWGAFISTPPADGGALTIAARFREGYDLRRLLRDTLSSEAFWAEANRASLIRSPAELIVGTLRTFALEPRGPVAARLARAGRALGQVLFNPPNVKGWPGGEAWIRSSSLMARRRFLEGVLRSPALDARMGSIAAWLSPLDAMPTPKLARRVLLAAEPVFPIPDAGEPHTILSALLLDPAYQLH